MDKVTPKPTDVLQANRDRAAPLLKKLAAEGIGHIINGKIVPSASGETFETKSPVDGAVLATVARGNAEDIDRAAAAASAAFKSWRDMPAAARRKLLHRVADAIEDNADDIAVLECIDTGQAHRFMAKAAISLPARRPANTSSRRCPRILIRSSPTASLRCRSTCRSTTRKPAGNATTSTRL